MIIIIVNEQCATRMKKDHKMENHVIATPSSPGRNLQSSIRSAQMAQDANARDEHKLHKCDDVA